MIEGFDFLAIPTKGFLKENSFNFIQQLRVSKLLSIIILFETGFKIKELKFFFSHLGKVIERLRELVRFKVRVCFAFEGNVLDLSAVDDELSFVEASSLIVTRFLSTLPFVDVDKFPTPAAALLRSESDNDLNGWCEVC
jgi:hypothetical protein